MRIFWLDNMWKVSVQDSLYSWHNLWKHKHSRNPNIHFKNVANVSFVWISNALSSILPTIRKYFLFKILVYIYIWLCLVFAATCRLSPVAASRAPLWLRGADFSLWWLLWLQSRASRRASVIEAPSSAVVACRPSCPWHGGSSQTRDWTLVSCVGRWILHHWTTREGSINIIMNRWKRWHLLDHALSEW